MYKSAIRKTAYKRGGWNKDREEYDMKSQKEPQKYRGIENGFYIAGICLAVIIFIYFLFHRMTGFRLEKYLSPCMFHEMTGYYCPGCGITRAVYAFFEGNLLQCFRYHPFVLYAAVFGGWFLISQTIERLSKGKIAIAMRYRDCYLWIALAILMVNFLVKNIALLFFHIDLLSL